jgi:hypothetical protein
MRKSPTVILVLGVVAILLNPSTGSAQPATYVGPPTPDLVAVSSAIQVQHKSLESLVTVAPGLALARPVTISIAYLSALPTGNDRITQTYDRATGIRFLRVDLEGDGKPRKLHLDITLSEANPAGGVYSFNVPMDLALEPLYDVAITPLSFTLKQNCNINPLVATEIDFYWISPDKQKKKETFKLKENGRRLITSFAFQQDEVGASADLLMPVFYFRSVHAIDTNDFTGFAPTLDPSSPYADRLVPGKPQVAKASLEHAQNEETCWADVEYKMTYQLRAYFGAPPVRYH